MPTDPYIEIREDWLEFCRVTGILKGGKNMPETIAEYWLSKLTEARTQRDRELKEKIEEMKYHIYPKPKDARERGLNIINTCHNDGLQKVLALLPDQPTQ